MVIQAAWGEVEAGEISTTLPIITRDNLSEEFKDLIPQQVLAAHQVPQIRLRQCFTQRLEANLRDLIHRYIQLDEGRAANDAGS